MPKRARGERDLDPEKLPIPLSTALTALYGHYEKTFELWRQAGTSVPPCFIVVCNKTATSKAVYDLVSGYVRRHDEPVQRLGLSATYIMYSRSACQ